MRCYALFLLLGMAMITPATAEMASRQEMRAVCLAWLEHQVAARGGWSGSRVPEIAGEQPILQGQDVLGCAFRIAPRGFVLVPARKDLCPVWFFSETGSLDFTTENTPADVLRGRLALTVEAAAHKADPADSRRRELAATASERNRSRWARMTESTSAWINENTRPVVGVGPLLSTAWHQGPPFNLLCPIGYGGARCVAGCLPIAAAQIARYHAYPPNGGTGEADYSWAGDDCGSRPSEGALLHADFRNAYDWDRMPDTCLGSCGGEADSAVAELCYELGVAGRADYGTACGTSAYLEQSVDALQVHFGYDSSAELRSRALVASAQEWFRLLQDEINASRPVLYAFTYLSGAGNHALVCDGWRIDAGIEYISLNLGGGGVTGWFAADDTGISDPLHDYAIFHLAPPERVATVGPNGDGDYPTIQAAIDAAHDGTVIELLNGVYRGPGNRDLNCEGKRIIIRSQSGDPALCIMDCEGTATDQHRAFLFNHDETFTTAIQGLTIRNGFVSSGNGTGSAMGGAVICEPDSVSCRSGNCASPRFTNCVFSQNRSDRGGAIGCSGSASPEIETCVFWKNMATQGGAFYKTGAGEIRISRSTFYANSAATGSALYAGPETALLLTRSIADNNRSGEAVYIADGGTARLSCCDLYANDGGDWTGGIADQRDRDANVSVDPMFCDAEAGDLRLDVHSPCGESGCGPQGARPAGCGELVYYVGAAAQYRYNTIAQALAVAREGGRIVLMDSLYTGDGNRDLTIPRRGLTIESASLDPVTCVLDVQGSFAEPHRAFRLLRKHGVTFRGITIRNGWMLSGGAIYAESADSTRFLDCVFRKCTAGGSFVDPGGGAVCIYGEGFRGGPTTLRNCSFEACTSYTGGGAVSLRYREFADTAFVDNCTFISNTARDRGGALAGSRARIKVGNSIFLTNSALDGGAVTVDAESRVWFESCTMVDNAATDEGGSVYINEAKTEGHFRNCILASNTGRPPIKCSSTPGTTVTVVCCDLWPDPQDGWGGCMSGRQIGNILQDPQFCSPQTGDYRLHATSPCLSGQPGNRGCGPVGALPVGCGPLPPDVGQTGLSFRRCVPNPFHQEVRIDYVIPAHAAGRTLDVSIYDAGGHLVRTLFRGPTNPGDQTRNWNGLDDGGRRVGSGVFFCRLRIGPEQARRRLIVLR